MNIPHFPVVLCIADWNSIHFDSNLSNAKIDSQKYVSQHKIFGSPNDLKKK